MSKNKSKFIKLGIHEKVVCAYAALAEGPGWSNQPLYVVIQSSSGTLREECIQPSEFSSTIWTLYGISDQLNRALVSEINYRADKQKMKATG